MNEATPERWLPVPEWEGLYEVTDRGRSVELRRGQRKRMRCRACVLRPTASARKAAIPTSSERCSRDGIEGKCAVATFSWPQRSAGPVSSTGRQVPPPRREPADNRWATVDELETGRGRQPPLRNAAPRTSRTCVAHGTNHHLTSETACVKAVMSGREENMRTGALLCRDGMDPGSRLCNVRAAGSTRRSIQASDRRRVPERCKDERCARTPVRRRN